MKTIEVSEETFIGLEELLGCDYPDHNSVVASYMDLAEENTAIIARLMDENKKLKDALTRADRVSNALTSGRATHTHLTRLVREYIELRN